MPYELFRLLKEDHDKLTDLLGKLDGLTENAFRNRLLNRFKSEMEKHANLEQTVLYPVLEQNEGLREATNLAQTEHELIDHLLLQLEVKVFDHDEIGWLSEFAVLKETVEHHLAEEENELFSAIVKFFEPAEIEELGEQLRLARQEESAA